jgi:putative transposase
MRPPKLSDEQIVALLREAERGQKSIAELCREAGVTETTFYRWRQKFGGSTVTDVRRLKELEKENARLLRLLGQRDVEIDGMKELLRKKW